jgi:hypothetical protein
MTTQNQRVSEWILGKRLINVIKEPEMLTIIAPGCHKHNRSQLTLFGSEAELVKNILYNLLREGEFHTFICEHGHTHHVSFQINPEKVVPDYAWEGNILPDHQ